MIGVCFVVYVQNWECVCVCATEAMKGSIFLTPLLCHFSKEIGEFLQISGPNAPSGHFLRFLTTQDSTVNICYNWRGSKQSSDCRVAHEMRQKLELLWSFAKWSVFFFLLKLYLNRNVGAFSDSKFRELKAIFISYNPNAEYHCHLPSQSYTSAELPAYYQVITGFLFASDHDNKWSRFSLIGRLWLEEMASNSGCVEMQDTNLWMSNTRAGKPAAGEPHSCSIKAATLERRPWRIL